MSHSFVKYLSLYNPLQAASISVQANSLHQYKSYILHELKQKFVKEYKYALYLIFGDEYNFIPIIINEDSASKFRYHVSTSELTPLLDELLLIKQHYHFDILKYSADEFKELYDMCKSSIPLVANLPFLDPEKRRFLRSVGYDGFRRRREFQHLESNASGDTSKDASKDASPNALMSALFSVLNGLKQSAIAAIGYIDSYQYDNSPIAEVCSKLDMYDGWTRSIAEEVFPEEEYAMQDLSRLLKPIKHELTKINYY